MTGPRLGALALAVAATFGGNFSFEHGVQLTTAQAQSEPLRPEVGRPLQAASELIKQRKFKEALAKLHEVDAVPNRSAYENFLLEQMRGSAAAQADQPEVAIKSFQALITSGRLSEAEQGKYAGYVASLYYRGRNYKDAASWAARALKANPNDAAMRSLLIQSYFQAGDFAAATREAQADIEAAEKAGQKPAEEKLQLLANIAGRQGGDQATYIVALEKLVAYYPKREYWADLLRRIESRPGFSQRLTLDVYRLRFATKTLTRAEDYVEMTQLALQERQAGEAKKVVDEGFASGVLGKGAEAERHKRLQALAQQRAASAPEDLKAAEVDAEPSALVRIGLAYSALGDNAKGIALIQQGIKKGGLRNPDDAQLHLGIAYLRAGEKGKAAQALGQIKSKDGAAELARLWNRLP
jgi:hypothetical protein